MCTIIPCLFKYGDPTTLADRLEMVKEAVEQQHPDTPYLIQINKTQIDEARATKPGLMLEAAGFVFPDEMWAVVE